MVKDMVGGVKHLKMVLTIKECGRMMLHVVKVK
jgi:hypothetical protein